MSAGSRRTADDILKERAENWPEAVTPITHLMVRIFRFSNLVLANAMRRIAGRGLSFTEFEVLVTLRGVAPPQELAPTALYSTVLMSSGGLRRGISSGARKMRLQARSPDRQGTRAGSARQGGGFAFR